MKAVYRLMIDLTMHDMEAVKLEGLYSSQALAMDAAEDYFGEQSWDRSDPFNMVYCNLPEDRGTIGVSTVELKA
jgi:hypothetical protein